VYALTDASRIGSRQDLIQELITAGVRWIQVREKSVPDIEFYEVVHWAVASLPAKVKLFVNDRLDIALACTADGVHLGEHDLPVSVARRVSGELLIGRSTHSAEDGIAASGNPDVDYVAIGPIFRSPTKNVRDPLGIEVIREIRRQTEKPIVAIGGIDETNIASVLEAGADAAAVISALYRDGTVAQNVRRLCDAAGRQ
jgi:thiamine-phosphate pyrophosphorylase